MTTGHPSKEVLSAKCPLPPFARGLDPEAASGPGMRAATLARRRLAFHNVDVVPAEFRRCSDTAPPVVRSWESFTVFEARRHTLHRGKRLGVLVSVRASCLADQGQRVGTQSPRTCQCCQAGLYVVRRLQPGLPNYVGRPGLALRAVSAVSWWCRGTLRLESGCRRCSGGFLCGSRTATVALSG